MKKVLSRILVCALCCVVLVSVASAAVLASNAKTVEMTTADYSVQSDPVGLGTRAYFNARNYGTSTGSMIVHGMACWSGWPYSTEVVKTLTPGTSSGQLQDDQTQASSFKIRLFGYNCCNGNGSVTLVK